MKYDFPDIDKFERTVFKKKNSLDLLLSFSRKLMQVRHVGLVFGTNRTNLAFLPPDKWDRGIIHKFNGKGISGLLLKYFGPMIVTYKGLSPVRLYKHTQFGEKKESDGVISFVLRKHKDFYEKGIKILIIDNICDAPNGEENYLNVSILSYNGKTFKSLPDLKVNNAIVKQFKAQNFVSAYVPDYGAIVFNTVNPILIKKQDDKFVDEHQLKTRLNILISAIEMASLAHIGHAKGRQAAQIIWRKEKNLRKTALRLTDKQKQLTAQKKYLKAVGAVNERQLNMEAVNINDGVYAFMDMVGSATIRKKFSPRDYFYILNLCHQIAANNANRFSCRVDNFIGDAVFLQNVSPFDNEALNYSMRAHERAMLMVLALSSIFNEIFLLKSGKHELDTGGRVKQSLDEAKISIGFRAGMETGSAMIGPLGSEKRRIVTAIGKAANNASRLESTGVRGLLHISPKIFDLLQDAYITRDTRIVQQVISGLIDIDENRNFRGINFFDSYKKIFRIKGDVIEERANVSYKEYTEATSYLLKCIPD